MGKWLAFALLVSFSPTLLSAEDESWGESDPVVTTQADLDRMAEQLESVKATSDLLRKSLALRGVQMTKDCTLVVPSRSVCECLVSKIPVGVESFAVYAQIMLRKEGEDLTIYSAKDQKFLKSTYAARRACWLEARE